MVKREEYYQEIILNCADIAVQLFISIEKIIKCMYMYKTLQIIPYQGMA